MSNIQHINGTYRCKSCQHTFTVSKPRLELHISGSNQIKKCPNPPTDLLGQLKAKLTDKKSRQSQKRLATSHEEPAVKKRTKQTTLYRATSVHRHRTSDESIMKLIVSCNLPLSIVGKPGFKHMVSAINKTDPSNIPPTVDSVSTHLLSSLVEDISKTLQTFVDSLTRSGTTIVSDGWKDRRKRPLINLLSTAPKDVMFIGTIDTSESEKSGVFIADAIMNHLSLPDSKQLGPVIDTSHIVQMIMDNAPACTKAFKKLAPVLPRVSLTGCATHHVDLIIFWISKQDFIQNLLSLAFKVVFFIRNHPISNHIFLNYSNDLVLLSPGETRFATNFIMLERLVRVKDAVQSTVISESWKHWLMDKPSKLKDQAKWIRELVLQDDDNFFWQNSSCRLQLFYPYIKLLRFVD
ncbi:hypothetical protein P9112_013521 [Eukaryota sp. TZLM1-RC]